MSNTPSQQAIQRAQFILDRVIELDRTVHGAFYELGQLLSSIAHGQLYEMLGYPSMAALIEEELSFSASQGYMYLNTYRHFQRLKYNKTEALDLINTFSFTNIAQWLPSAKQKVGKRAVSSRVKEMLQNKKQINFALSGDDNEELIKTLEKFGAERTDGYLKNSSSALMALVRHVNANAEASQRLSLVKS